ncbi:MAG: hypothetical protein OEL79_09710, partial [Chromatiales bacterium]|nr:hypothetical protein [Chromatiales bacterium]
ISFLHKMEQIFSTTEATILTGKVVGDPPVSPAVMASNFLEDVISFLQQIGAQLPQQKCSFHHNEFQKVDDASYHDMADLFGFKTAIKSYHYNCNISGDHNHGTCFNNFAKKLNRFFDGEHPTRKTYYEHENLLANIKPARTIYTGNYIFKPSALDYFIPFAALKLRMAGPVLGRVIKAEIGEAFVSVNLPMLHKRTVHESGQSEFRPGVDRTEKRIDLSGEFERQFFGDVMLFTIDKLTQSGYPKKPFSKEEVFNQVEKIERAMHKKYSLTREQIIRKIGALDSLFNDTSKWWNQHTHQQQEKDNIATFIANMSQNFGDGAEGYRLITSDENRQSRLSDIVAAIIHYADDRETWHSTLNRQRTNP